MSDFGDKLIELRNKSKLSLKEVCKQIGIPASRLVELERGVRIPTIGQIEHLEKFYGVNFGGLARLSQKTEKTD